MALLLPLRASALDSAKTLAQYAHRIWGQEEGLFQPTIYSILQTRDGFLWLGTQDSLIRFDGLHFREFDRAEEAGLHNTLIHALAEDHAGNLWVGSLGEGITKITPAGQVKRYTSADGLPSDTVFCLAEDSVQQVWACTNQGLVVLRADRLRTLTTAQGLPSNQIRSTCQTPDGARWVAGLDFGLASWRGSHFEAYSDRHIAAKENVTALACANDGSVWAGTGNGVVRIRGNASRRFTVRDRLPDNAVSSLVEATDGSIWIGTNDGISRFRDGDISVYRTRDGLSHSVVLSLYVDREGSLWAGTKDGLDQFTDGKVTPYTTTEGLSGNEAGPVLEDGAGRLWIGTRTQGLNWFDGRRFHVLTKRAGLADNRILSLELDKTGDVWVGTGRGLNRLRDGRVRGSYGRAEGLPGVEIRALFHDAEGTLWAGTDNGLARLEGTRFRVESLPSSLRTHAIVAVAGGRAVQLFVSTDAPAFFVRRNNTWSSYSLDVIRSVDCYFLDHTRHSAWMGTVGSGLLRWQNGTFTHVRVKDGLYDNRIYSILRDDEAHFWMASSKGIFRVSQQELDDFADGKIHYVHSIPFSTGQLRFECQSGVQPAAYRTHDGRLWFSTTNGVVVVDPNHLVSNQVAPSIQVTAVLANGRRKDLLQHSSLQPAERNIEIRYAALSFVSPEKVIFRYMLDGYDKTWTDAGSRREAFFTNLPPGHFQFKVMARNADGIWSSRPAVLRFEIEPQFYQRRWFFPVVLLAAVLAIVLGYRMRIRRLSQRFDLLLAERGRIARELHDTLLQGLSGITLQMQALWTRLPPSRERQFLREIIQDAGKCSAEARHSVWGLRAPATATLQFSDKLAKLARDAVNGKAIALSLQLQPVSLVASPDAEYQLQRIVQEAISNVIAHAQAANLSISLGVEDSYLELRIEDDGVGFDSGRAQSFGRFGLIGMRERAAEIGAELAIDSYPGQGTKVRVRLPFAAPPVTDSNAEIALEHQVR